MPTFNTTNPKPGYVYDSGDDTWYPLAGIAVQTLDGLTDVVISTAASGQTLVYNGTNWVNTAETGDVSAVSAGTGITVTSGAGPIPSIAVDDTLVATTSNTMTLSNKTLTSPTINTATLTGGTLTDAILRGTEEDVNVVASAATGTINFDVSTASIWYYTSNAGANHTLNFRYSSSTSLNSVLATGDAMTLVWLNTNGATPYYPNVITVDGATSGVSIKVPSAITAGNASAIDAYSFTLIKTAATSYTVLETQTKFA